MFRPIHKKKVLIISFAVILVISVILAVIVTNSRPKPTPKTDNTKSLINSATTNADSKTDSKMVIATSFYPIEFITRSIIGDKASVFNPVPANADLHNFEPTTQDTKKINQAKVFFYQGDGIDPWATKIAQSQNNAFKLQANNNTEVAGSLKILDQKDTQHKDGENEKDHDHDHKEESKSNPKDLSKDPHTWLSIKQMISNTEMITTKVIEVDNSNSEYYKTNSLKLIQDLKTLDSKFKQNLFKCNKRTIVVAHNAYNYLAKDYDFEIEQLSGVNSEREPTTQELTKILQNIKDKGISTIYYDTTINPKLAKSIAQESKTKTLPLYSLESLTSDQQSKNLNFVQLMEQNLANLMIGMECNPN